MTHDDSHTLVRPRIAALNVVRGFALCGILLANIQPIASVDNAVVQSSSTTEAAWMGVLVHQRFFPIFSLLFGIGFSLLLNSAADRVYGVIDRIERSALVPAVLGLVLVAGAAPFLWLQGEPGHPRSFAAAGLLLAGVYVCALLVLLRTPLRTTLRVVFAPLGRMALTNYLTATFLVLAIALVIEAPSDGWSLTTVLLIAGAIVGVQWLWSTIWLRRHGYGPVEWLWRWATWWRRLPLHRPGAVPADRRVT